MAMRTDGELTYLFGDHLRSTNVTYTPGATVEVTRQDYLPFAQPRTGTKPSPPTTPTPNKSQTHSPDSCSVRRGSDLRS